MDHTNLVPIPANEHVRLLGVGFREWFNNGTFWIVNGTFDFEDFCADAKELGGYLHPVSDVDVNGVVASAVINGVTFVGLIILYEWLRRVFPNVYASRFRREKELRIKTKLLRRNPEAPVDPEYQKPAKGKKRFNDKTLPQIHKQIIPLEWIGSVFGVSQFYNQH